MNTIDTIDRIESLTSDINAITEILCEITNRSFNEKESVELRRKTHNQISYLTNELREKSEQLREFKESLILADF